ncbi:hypothetical protein [Actinomadura luteofluorescens]|uniref:hypothetical protein n=1 Tax=Actinomadura luteofluorescens TaxID=46163 RepID=UPI0030D071EC
MALKIQVLKCGRCGKPRGLTHTCVTRMDRRTKPGKTRLKPRVTATCRTCGKPRGLNHTCRISTDFKKRKAAAARREAAERKRRQAARRKAAAAARRKNTTKPRKPTATKPTAKTTNGKTTPAKVPAGKTGAGKATHDYRTCNDTDCPRYACQAWKEAYAEAMAIGLEDGYQQGHEQGRRETSHQAGGMPANEKQIKARVAADFAEDNVREDEILLKPNGDIVIDRRKTVAWAQPVVIGRWKP